jgi:hypothetical protein
MEAFGIWVAALLTLAIYSFLYKDNPFYKFAEHLYVGISTGYLVVVTLQDALRRDLYEPLAGAAGMDILIVLLPGIFGVLIFTRFIKNLAYLSRISIAIIIGATAGIYIPNQIQGYLLKHTSATIMPLASESGTVADTINQLLILIGVISVLVYFFFSVRRREPVKSVSRVGTFYLMLFFGAAFGNTVMGRISLLIGRLRFLLLDWLGLGG